MRQPDFRRLWTAQFTSNVGSWMQTVAAQWVMISLTRSAVLLAAVSAAGSISVLLVAVPAGALGDLLDRRGLILASQALMLLAAAGLAVLSALGSLAPGSLLGLLFVIGVGAAVSAPTWQTLQPELVAEADRTQAIALGSVNQNLARAIGPAIGGALLAATSAAAVFAVNALSFVAVLIAVAVSLIPRRARTLPREHVIAATRAGGRFVGNSPVLLALIARSIAFVFFAGAIWALLPLVAHHRLHLGSGGYGLLLGCVGLGAIAAATYGPALRRALPPRAIYALSCLAVAGAAVVLGVTHSIAITVLGLILAGGAWITGLGLLSSGYQSQLPAWVKARSFSYYLVAFQGAGGIGSLTLGAIAQTTSLVTALLVVAGGLVVFAIVTWPLSLPAGPDPGMTVSEPLPLPSVGVDVAHGPVLITVDYALAPGRAEAFIAAAYQLRRMRRRTGASSWHLHRHIELPDVFTETFLVGSWEEHELQHARTQRDDIALLEEIDKLLAPGQQRTVEHALGVVVRHNGRRGRLTDPAAPPSSGISS